MKYASIYLIDVGAVEITATKAKSKIKIFMITSFQLSYRKVLETNAIKSTSFYIIPYLQPEKNISFKCKFIMSITHILLSTEKSKTKQ